MPIFFGDLGKRSNDLLNDDFNFDTRVEVKSQADRVHITSSLTRDHRKGSILGVIKTKFFPINYVTVNTNIDTAGKFATTTTVDKFAEGVKLTIDNTLSTGATKLSGEVSRDAFAINGSVELGATPKISAGAVAHHGNVSAGVQVNDLDVGNAKFGVQYDAGTFSAAAQCAKQCDDLQLSYFHKAQDDISVAGKYNMIRSTGTHKFELGFLYAIDKRTSLRSKVDSAGVVSVVYGQDLRQGLAVKAAAQFDTTNTAKPLSKIGVAFTAEL